MGHENPNSENKTIDNAQNVVLGTEGGEAPIVTPLPDVVKPEEKITPENDQKILPEIAEADLTNDIQAAATAYAGFDPKIHAANPDGTPKLKKDGGYQLKRGRKAGDFIAQPLPDNVAQSAPNIDTATDAPAPAPKVDYTGLGKVYAGMFFGATMGLIGPEWAPTDADEKKQVEQAFTMYAKSTGAVDLPPGWALVFALGIYGAKRVQHENTRSKLALLKDKAKMVWLWFKTRRG